MTTTNTPVNVHWFAFGTQGVWAYSRERLELIREQLIREWESAPWEFNPAMGFTRIAEVPLDTLDDADMHADWFA